MPTVQSYVLYPNDDSDTFDLDFYLKNHMPLVQKIWGPLGLIGWEVTNITDGSDNAEAAYTTVTILEWDSKESLKAALAGSDGKQIVANLPNFSNRTPVMFAGDVVAEWGSLKLDGEK